MEEEEIKSEIVIEEFKSEIVIEEFKSEMILEDSSFVNANEEQEQHDMFITFNPQELPEEQFLKTDGEYSEDTKDTCTTDVPVHVQIKEESQDLLDENIEDAFIGQDVKPDVQKIVILPSESLMAPAPLPVIQTIRNFKQWEMGNPPFACEHCSLSFSEYRVFRDHTMETHGQDPIVACDICNVPCGSNSEFVKHREKNHNEEMCLVCKKMIISQRMTIHLRVAHKRKERPTIEDSVLNAQQSSTTRGVRDRGSKTKVEEQCKIQETFKCNNCEKKFSDKKVYKIHVKRANCKKMKICEPPSQEPQPRYLKVPIVCPMPMCSDRFKDKLSLTLHISSHNEDRVRGIDKTLLSCQECKRGYRDLNRMVEHRILVHGFRPVNNEICCEICTKRFPTHKLLIRHEKICKDKIH